MDVRVAESRFPATLLLTRRWIGPCRSSPARASAPTETSSGTGACPTSSPPRRSSARLTGCGDDDAADIASYLRELSGYLVPEIVLSADCQDRAADRVGVVRAVLFG